MLALLLLPGVFTVAYLWLRADASIAWGDTRSVAGIWDHLAGRVYQDAVERSPSVVLAAVPETLRRTLAQLPLAACLLVVPGGLAIARSRPALGLALATACVLLIVFVSAYRATGRQDYLATVVLVASMAAGYGAVEAWAWIRHRLPTERAARAAALGAWGLLAVWVVVNGNAVSLRGETTLHDAAIARLQAQEPGAVIETGTDADTFSLWYAQVVLGERPDVTIRDVRGLAPVIGGTD